MKLLCQKCEKMPFIKLSYIEEGKILVIINCKCGKNFYDISTFASEYTDIDVLNQTNLEKIIYNSEIKEEHNNLKYFCETCFENIYNNLDNNHINHQLIKIDDSKLISSNELDNIDQNLIKAENKILDYLPKMRDMLIDDCKNEKEKKEIKYHAEFSFEKNQLILNILKLLYNLYIINHNQSNNFTYQVIQNLKLNSDYNLNKYNLDLKTIEKDKFMTFIKYCLILCCNYSINKVYQNFIKEKQELKKMILSLESKVDKEKEKEGIIIFCEEIMKSNNSIYYGEKNTLNNLAEGRGFLYFASGTYYLGYFINDVFQDGYGKSVNKKGSIYMGQFKEGAANGFGKLITFGGNKYEGTWTNNKLDGFGSVVSKNGRKYIGDIKEGFFTGIGEMQQKNNNFYRGEFKEGRMHGIGVLEYVNKKKYVGEFEEGYKTGYGEMTWPNGEKYEGSWKKDIFVFGKYLWPTGNIYIGNFDNNGVNGYGTFYSSALGTIESGVWKNGRREDINNKENIPSTIYISFL